ncbi:MAG: hypothetical protein WDZ44_01400 [Candidatus Spechtbacterales bacterium]
MAEIIPAILTDNFEDAYTKAGVVVGIVRWIHLDVSDGVFAPRVTWGEPERIRELGNIRVVAHLMVKSPEEILPLWLDSGVARIFIHYEATQEHERCISMIKGAGIEVGIALLQGTSVDVIAPFSSMIDAVLVFSGSLGSYGGVFQGEETLSKISTLRRHYPDLTIEVDGGMNLKSARMVVEAGADVIVSGGFIFRNKNPQQAIEELEEATK